MTNASYEAGFKDALECILDTNCFDPIVVEAREMLLKQVHLADR